MTETTSAEHLTGLGDGVLARLMAEMACPQPLYRELIESGGFVGDEDGMAQVYSRELNDYVLRHHELFSSGAPLGLGNIRPLIPLNVDPPQHSKYRKILD